MHANQTTGAGDQHAEQPSSSSSAPVSEHHAHASVKDKQIDPALPLPAAYSGRPGSVEDINAMLAADSWQGGLAQLGPKAEMEAKSHAFAAMDQHISTLELAVLPALPDTPSPIGLYLAWEQALLYSSSDWAEQWRL